MNNRADIMATVAGVYDDGLTLIFDGQTEATKKHYKCNTTAAFTAGMRVKVVKISGTYIVEYPVGNVGTGSTGGSSGSTGSDGGYYIPAVEQTDANTMKVSFSPSKAGMNSVASKEITLPSGEDGEDGTSVTVASVSESSADDGNNVVTFSDGKKLNVKNGSKGSSGYTPQKGVDYFDGENGVSPTVEVSKTGKVTTIAITDAEGTNTATINDGADGSPGKDGESPTVTVEQGWDNYGNAFVARYTMTIKNPDGMTQTVSWTTGVDGANGKPGDIYVPTVSEDGVISWTRLEAEQNGLGGWDIVWPPGLEDPTSASVNIKGSDGRGISSLSVDAEGVWTVTYTDGATETVTPETDPDGPSGSLQPGTPANVTVGVVDALPEADETLRGRMIIVPNDDTDELFICMKKAGKIGWMKFEHGGNQTTSELGVAILGTLVLGGR